MKETMSSLRGRIGELENSLGLLQQDYDGAIDALEKLQRRHILVRVRHHGHLLLDAFLIPPSGAMSGSVTVDPIDDDNYVEVYSEVVT